jgi:exopolysaccharide biosynthesis WecB/TagA/CpsF family protein
MNGQTIYECLRDPEIQRLFASFDITSMDGQPAVSVSRRWAEPFAERVATTDLIHDVFEAGSSRSVRHYLFGAAQPVLDKARRELERRHSGAIIVGTHHGYVSADELPSVINDIYNREAEVLWICMGIPREQTFALQIADAETSLAIIKTGGGVLDFVSGEKPRAPGVMQAVGLEWLYRLWLEPRRLGKRYLTSNPVAMRHLLSLNPIYRQHKLFGDRARSGRMQSTTGSDRDV